MSAPQPSLTWPETLGWLILSGGGEDNDTVRAQTLQRLKPEGGVAYLGLRDSALDLVMDDLDDLGAPTGYLVNILTEDDVQIESSLREVSLIVLDGEENPARLYDALQGAALDAIYSAYLGGAVILAEGNAASLFGAHWLDLGMVRRGAGWLRDSLVLPGIADRAELRPAAQRVFDEYPNALAVGLPHGAALVLGPDGHLELWGDSPVAVTLGPGYV